MTVDRETQRILAYWRPEDFETGVARLRREMSRQDAIRAAADGYLPSRCPLGLHDNLYPGPDGECDDCELQGLTGTPERRRDP